MTLEHDRSAAPDPGSDGELNPAATPDPVLEHAPPPAGDPDAEVEGEWDVTQRTALLLMAVTPVVLMMVVFILLR